MSNKYSISDRTYKDENGIVGIRRVAFGRPQPTDAEIDAAIAKFNATIKQAWGEDATMEQFYETHRGMPSDLGDFDIGSLSDRQARASLRRIK